MAMRYDPHIAQSREVECKRSGYAPLMRNMARISMNLTCNPMNIGNIESKVQTYMGLPFHMM
jgi:hypothetical protein